MMKMINIIKVVIKTTTNTGNTVVVMSPNLVDAMVQPVDTGSDGSQYIQR